MSANESILNKLYGRRWRVLVQTKDNTVLDVSKLRITFSIAKSYMGEHYGEILIYNLNPETETGIIEEGSRVIVEAGYEGSDNYGVIFDGSIIQPIRYKEDNINYTLKLICLDSDDYRNFGIVNFSMQKGQNARDMIQALASNASIASELNSISEDFYNTPKTIRGKTFFGLGKDYLRQLAQSHNATYYNEDGKINIIKLSDLPNDEAIELDYDSGLIGMPEQVDFGVNCKTLLIPTLKLNKFIKINNKLIKTAQFNIGNPYLQPLDSDGLYRIFKINYIGDSRGNDWYCQLETVSQAGFTPSMLESSQQYGW